MKVIIAIAAATIAACQPAPVATDVDCPPPPDPVQCLKLGQAVASAALSIQEAVDNGADATDLENHADSLAERAQHYMHCSVDLVIELTGDATE